MAAVQARQSKYLLWFVNFSQSLTDRDLQPNIKNDDFVYVYFNQSNCLMSQDVLNRAGLQ